ncbi:MAG: hypothetical protein IPL62_06455 [Caulobacteraceae bacterium]|nr:hypothetical protein [Caulobacteraceae bacterium]
MAAAVRHARARDLFCVEAEDGKVPSALLDDLVPGARQDLKLEELEATAVQLRWLERIAMGVVPNLVSKRVDGASKKARAFFDGQHSEDDGRSELFLLERLDSAAESGFRFSRPYAVTRIKDALLKLQDVRSPRVGAVLRIKLPFKPKNGSDHPALTAPEWEDKVRALTDPAELESVLDHITKQPARLFVLASWLAFRRDLWSDAVRFAGFAERAPQENDEFYAECQYFRAVSLRIRLMSEPPAAPASAPAKQREADVWRSDMNAAIVSVESCLDLLPDVREVRRLRAKAEGVAARMAYCGWAAVGELASLNAYQIEPLDLSEIFSEACDGLAACIEELGRLKDQSVDRRDAKNAQTQDLDWVWTQVSLTAEYSRLIYVCLTQRFDRKGRAYLPAMRAWEWLGNMQEHPPPDPKKQRSVVLAAYGFCQWGRFAATVKDAKEWAESLQKLDYKSDTESGREMLALDRSMLELMKDVAAVVLRCGDADAEAWTPTRWNDAVVAVVRGRDAAREAKVQH